ncbi:MAG: RsmG family class I SAM-dependent methyltransferase [Candidatus Absconditabacterales bacterium]
MIDLFLHHNAQVNLSAIRDPEGVYLKHIFDSLELLNVPVMQDILMKPGVAIADVGTGGGFPLLALAKRLPHAEFVGIDSVRKKLQVIATIAKTLELKNVSVVRSRMEEVSEPFNIVTARAVAHVKKLIPRVQSLLRTGSKLVLYKEYSEEEKEAITKLLSPHHMMLIGEHRYVLFPGDIQRVIYVLEKL